MAILLDTSTLSGSWGVSFQGPVFLSPTTWVDVTLNKLGLGVGKSVLVIPAVSAQNRASVAEGCERWKTQASCPIWGENVPSDWDLEEGNILHSLLQLFGVEGQI